MSDDAPEDDGQRGARPMADLGGLLEQAQQVMAAQQAASEREIEGVAGGGVVRIRTTGTGQVLGVTIAPEVVDPADVAMLEDLVLAALHDMNAKLLEIQREAMGPLAGLGDLFGGELMAGVYAQPVQELIDELGRLPGVGPKSAQRIAFHLLKVEKVDALRLAQAITEAKDRVTFCDRCFNIAEGASCGLCADDRRDATVLCVVEEPRDIVAVEKTQEFNGRYHVLQGAISPIEGIGPEQLRIRELLARIERRGRGGGHPLHQPQPRGRGHRDVPRPAAQGPRRAGDPHRERAAGGRRPRVRRRAHARPGAGGPPRGGRLSRRRKRPRHRHIVGAGGQTDDATGASEGGAAGGGPHQQRCDHVTRVSIG